MSKLDDLPEERRRGLEKMEEVYGFESAAAARSAQQSASEALTGCSTTSYEVHTVPLQGGSVTVEAATGADADVVWMVQSGPELAYVAIPAGHTTPPDLVTRAVGALLLHNLDVAQRQDGTTEAP